MKIINVIHKYGQNMGGVDQMFRFYNQSLIDNGNDVSLIISKGYGNDYRLPKMKKIYQLRNLTPALDFLHMWLIFILSRPDIIIFHSGRQIKLMRWMKYIIPAKTVAVNHGPGKEYLPSINCDYVFSLNEKTRNLVIGLGKSPDKSILMPNMIKIDANQKFNFKKFHDPVTIGIFGRFEPRKGFDILIKAAAILKEKQLPFKLIIGGFSVENCSYNEDTIKNFVKENQLENQTEFFGVVKNKAEFFDKVDILCVPSTEEPFGMVIIEGFLYSTPIISSDTDGGKLIIEDNKDGILFPINDHKALAAKLEFIINNENNAKEIAKNAFDKVKEKYDMNKVGKFLQAELEKILLKRQT